MAPARRRLVNLVAVVLAAAATAAAVPDIPVHGGAWTTTTSRQRGQGKASIDGSHQQLEEQACWETRETFGEDFCQQLRKEEQAVREAREGRARIGREAGCSPTSPLSSPSLGTIGAPGNGDETTGEGKNHNDAVGPSIGDWLR